MLTFSLPKIYFCFGQLFILKLKVLADGIKKFDRCMDGQIDLLLDGHLCDQFLSLYTN